MRELEEVKQHLKEYLQSLDNPIYMIDFNTIVRKYEEQIEELRTIETFEEESESIDENDE